MNEDRGATHTGDKLVLKVFLEFCIVRIGRLNVSSPIHSMELTVFLS
jgi:hypothetical protein